MQPEPQERAWALPAAAAVLALENVGVLGALLLFGAEPPLVPLFLALKFPACVGLLQRRHGAFMLLTLWEAVTLVVAFINPVLDLAPRFAVAAGATLGLTLLGMSIRLFPEVELPRRAPDPGGSWN